MLYSPVEMHVACYGGIYIPALSASYLSPLLLVLPRFLINFWFISCISCIFPLCFKQTKLIVLTNKPGKGLIFYKWISGGCSEPQLAAAAVHEVCSVHCNVCTVSCLHQAAPCALLGHLRTLQLPVGTQEGYVLPSSRKKFVGLSGSGGLVVLMERLDMACGVYLVIVLDFKPPDLKILQP